MVKNQGKKLMNFFKPLYKRIFPNWLDDLKREVTEYDTVLDLACGKNSPIQHCKLSYCVGVELYEPYLEVSKKKGIHNEYIKEDIRKINFDDNSFDIVFCSEAIEHLKKEEGYQLIERMKKWARKKIILKVPNGFVWHGDIDNNILQRHQSEWYPEDLKSLGFRVHGINGWKKLRGYKGSFKFKPKILWQVISDITQKITHYLPQYAFQMFAVKNMGKSRI